jgi:hypothetical protein
MDYFIFIKLNNALMEELAVCEMPQEHLPKSLAELQAKLEDADLIGDYRIAEHILELKNEDGTYHFELYEAFNAGEYSGGPGIEISGNFKDAVGVIIELQEVLETIFPQCSFSSVFDD